MANPRATAATARPRSRAAAANGASEDAMFQFLAAMMVPIPASLHAEGLDRVHAGGATRGQPGRGERGQKQQA
jgi:hypothetical protein